MFIDVVQGEVPYWLLKKKKKSEFDRHAQTPNDFSPEKENTIKM